jgi:hypothetical protein
MEYELKWKKRGSNEKTNLLVAAASPHSGLQLLKPNP